MGMLNSLFRTTKNTGNIKQYQNGYHFKVTIFLRPTKTGFLYIKEMEEASGHETKGNAWKSHKTKWPYIRKKIYFNFWICLINVQLVTWAPSIGLDRDVHQRSLFSLSWSTFRWLLSYWTDENADISSVVRTIQTGSYKYAFI